MGKFAYGLPAEVIDIDDRLLAHLRSVIVSKLRRDESFMFTWEYPVSSGSGHCTLWIHPSVPLRFIFSGNREPQLNIAWLQELMMSANTVRGLHVMPEPQASGMNAPAAVPESVPA